MRYTVTPVVARAPEPARERYEPMQQPPPPRMSLDEFVHHLERYLQRYTGEIFNSLLAARVSNEIYELIQEVKFHRQMVEIFPEVELTRVEMEFAPADREYNVHRIQIKKIWTQSLMQPPQLHGQYAYLGRKRGVEMYIGYQDPIPPTLVLIFDGEIITFNPKLMQTPSTDHPLYEFFFEGLIRYKNATEFIRLVLPEGHRSNF